MSNSAAFFDLDKTLMAGSSGMVFARVANRKGFVPRRQLARWGVDHLRYRLRGSSECDKPWCLGPGAWSLLNNVQPHAPRRARDMS